MKKEKDTLYVCTVNNKEKTRITNFELTDEETALFVNGNWGYRGMLNNFYITECEKDNDLMGGFIYDLLALAGINYDYVQGISTDRHIVLCDDSYFDYDFQDTIKQNLDKLKEYTKQVKESYKNSLEEDEDLRRGER